MRMTEKQITVILFVFSLFYLFPIISMPVNAYDEGIILTGADRILKGHVPYKDFWTIYTPGQYYVLALLFKIFGSSILTERIYDIIIKACICVLSFSIVRIIGYSRKIALASFGMSLFWIACSGCPVYPVYPSILLIHITCYCILHYIRNNNIVTLLFCSVLTIIIVLFRHDFGAMTFIAITILILNRIYLYKEAYFYELLYFFVMIFLTAFPVLIIASHNIGLNELFNQMIVVPYKIMPKFRWLPYPNFSFSNIAYYAFPVIIITAIIVAIYLHKYHKKSQGVLLLSLIGFFLLNQVRVRSDSVHLIPAVIFGSLLVPILFDEFKKISLIARAIVYIFFIAIVGISIFNAIYGNIFYNYRYRNIEFVNIHRAGQAAIPFDLQYTISYIQKMTSIDEPIYVGVANHDQFIVNSPIIYYLSERNYATRFHQFDPGVSNTLKAQQIIIEEIERAKVRLLVLSTGYWYEPNDTQFDFKIDLVDNYIKKQYNISAKFGDYLIFRKKEGVHGTKR